MKKVIDSHIHLYSETHLQNVIPWIKPGSKLAKNHRLDEYLEIAKSSNHKVAGAIFMETDVRNQLNEEGWVLPIEEYLYVERTVLNTQLEGEGTASGANFIKAIIPWAPIPQGKEEVNKFVNLMRTKSMDANTFNLVKGFRYLLQAKPKGTMLQPKFIESLNWLAEKGYVFDLGLDIRSDGIWHLEEFVQLIKKTKNVRYILNHLSKPVLTLNSKETLNSEVFTKWKELMKEVASDENNEIYIKVSGGFSELPEDSVNQEDLSEVIDRISHWLGTFVELFPKDHFIFGSDWPVCSVKVEKTDFTWEKWAIIVDQLTKEFNLGDEVYYENIIKAYNLE